MLISVYNNSGNATDFQQDFTENIILAPNSTIKMLKAFIPTNRSLNIPADMILEYTLGGFDYPSTAITIPAGFYGLNEIAKVITELVTNSIVATNQKGTFSMTHNEELGNTAGAFSFSLANLTFTPNIAKMINWNDAGTPTADWKTTTIVATTTFYKNFASLGTSSLLSSAGNPVKSWGYIGHFDTHPLYKSIFNNTNDINGAIPPISHPTANYGALWWNNRYGGNAGATNATYSVSICSATPDVSNVTANNNITEFRKQKGIYSMVVVCGQAINSAGVVASKGDLLIWEDDGSGFLAPVGRFEAGIGANDQIAIVIPDDTSPLEYWVNFNGTGIWREIGGLTGTRYANAETDDIYMGFTAFEAMPTPTPSQANIKQIWGSFDFLGEYGNWGEYVKFDWKTQANATKFGYSAISYDKDTSGEAVPTLATIVDEKNDDPIPVSDDTENINRMPFVNVNINELPLQNYTISNPNSLGLSSSRTICSVPRYDILGNFKPDKADAIVFENNTQVCPLNNAQEISISQLTFSIRNADGSVPTDLATPQGYILDVQPQTI